MKRLKYFILLLLIFSVFSPIFAQSNRDYGLWYKEHEWLMLKQEKNDWKSLKTERAKEDFIEKFYIARDPDTFTYKNEFQPTYQRNLERIRKDYPNLDDGRRYIYLLFGEPDSRRPFKNLNALITSPFVIKIHVNEAEIWRYNFGGQNFQVIFAKLNIHQLRKIRDQQQAEEFIPASLYSSEYEILYIGLSKYLDIETFLESFFQENLQLRDTSDTINDLKKQISDRAKEFYEGSQPRVKKERYSQVWDKGLQVFISQFDIKAPEEAGVAIWISFNKDSLNHNDKKKEYEADICLYCKIRDVNGNQIVYYRDDCSKYKLKEAKNYFYHFWGSLPSGKYKLTLEIAENISKKYRKIELDIDVFDYSAPVLTATLLIGKIVKDSDNSIQGKPSYLSFGSDEFYPAFSGECFRDNDEMAVIFDISGFKRNNYGSSYLEVALVFTRGSINQDGKFVPSNEIYSYSYLPMEEKLNRFQSVVKLKIKDLTTKLKLPPGYYRVGLSIDDKVANISGRKDHSYVLQLKSTTTVNNK